MSTIVSRTFASTPKRDAAQTWTAIVDLLTHGRIGPARNELLAVSGVAACLIADQVPKNEPITVTCGGPRIRIYCLYDEDAIAGSDANEDSLGFDALAGDWRASLPCLEEDMQWVQGALKKHSARVTARNPAAEVAKAKKATPEHVLTLDAKGFLGT